MDDRKKYEKVFLSEDNFEWKELIYLAVKQPNQNTDSMSILLRFERKYVCLSG